MFAYVTYNYSLVAQEKDIECGCARRTTVVTRTEVEIVTIHRLVSSREESFSGNAVLGSTPPHTHNTLPIHSFKIISLNWVGGWVGINECH